MSSATRALQSGSTSTTGTTRREVLSALLATAVWPVASRAARIAATPADLIIVGAGSAGLPAAIAAVEQGARVVLIDKAADVGGTLHRSSGQVAAAGTRFQRAKGIQDSVEEHIADILRISEGTVDEALVREFAQHAPATIEWLAGLGFEPLAEHPVVGAGHEPFLTARYMWGRDNGRTILAVLRPALERAGRSGRLEVLLGHGAVELMESRGAVSGVLVEAADGKRIALPGSRVLLTSGGCAANPVLFERLHGVPLYANLAYPFSQGDGLALGTAAGGYLRGGEKYLPLSGAVLKSAEIPSQLEFSLLDVPGGRAPWEIQVNADGRRFIAEDEPSVHRREKALLAQPHHRCWIVFDERILREAPPLVPGWSPEKVRSSGNAHPMFSSGPTLETLAARAGISPDGLQSTVEEFNAGQTLGRDPLGRKHLPRPVAVPPFHAIRVQGWTLISFAGLAVDERLRVVTRAGMPVRNLYAAGEILGAGATCGQAYVNGMTLTPALTFGRLLGSRVHSI